jgi:hypothetical protein
MRRCLVLLFVLTALVPQAQKKVVLESWRWYDRNPLLTQYLTDAAVKKKLASDLNNAMYRFQGLRLSDTNTVNIRLVDFDVVMPQIRPVFEDADTNHLHLYINSIETLPYYFFRSNEESAKDSAAAKRAKTIFLTSAVIFDYSGKPVFAENITSIISEAPTNGIGFSEHIGYSNLFVLPGTFISWQKTVMAKLMDPENQTDAMEIRLQPAYYSDNFILPATIGQPRVFVQENKGVYAYRLHDTTELIRLTEPQYQQILLKGKNKPVYPEQVLSLIKAQDEWSRSDFVWLKQDLRDVVRNSNLTLQMIIQVNPLAQTDQQGLLTGFLPGQVHYLFNNRDTIARFSIRKKVTVPAKRIFSSTIGNGYDSSQHITNNIGRDAGFLAARYEYTIEGVFREQPFRILCAGYGSSIKEIYFNNRLICIAEGKTAPEKFVVFDASLPNETLNTLLLLAYNQFFP